MFKDSIRKNISQQLQHPLRLKELHERSADLMQGTRYQYVESFVAALKKENIIQVYKVKANNGKTITVYCSIPLEDVDTYELATSLFSDGYFCNMTAIYYHSLTAQIPSRVYWCHETIVPRKIQRNGELISDSRVRSAFIKPPRYTNFIIENDNHDIVVIDRARGSDYGVEAVQRRQSPCPRGSRVTTLERTLIDAVVSPHYNGGITSLCDYFRAADGKLDIVKMLNIYQKLNYIYPYAQSLGFFMDHSGLQSEAEKIRSVYPPRQHFYVDHGAKTSWVFDKKWMIFYPKGLVNEN